LDELEMPSKQNFSQVFEGPAYNLDVESASSSCPTETQAHSDDWTDILKIKEISEIRQQLLSSTLRWTPILEVITSLGISLQVETCSDSIIVNNLLFIVMGVQIWRYWSTGWLLLSKERSLACCIILHWRSDILTSFVWAYNKSL